MKKRQIIAEFDEHVIDDLCGICNITHTKLVCRQCRRYVCLKCCERHISHHRILAHHKVSAPTRLSLFRRIVKWLMK